MTENSDTRWLAPWTKKLIDYESDHDIVMSAPENVESIAADIIAEADKTSNPKDYHKVKLYDADTKLLKASQSLVTAWSDYADSKATLASIVDADADVCVRSAARQCLRFPQTQLENSLAAFRAALVTYFAANAVAHRRYG